MCLWVLSHNWLFATLWTIAHQAPLSMGFPRQEFWSELPFPPPEDLRDPGIKPVSPELVGRFFTTRVTWEASLDDKPPQNLNKSRERQKMRWLDSITDVMNMNLGKLWEVMKDRKAWHATVHVLQRVGHDWTTEQQQQQQQEEGLKGWHFSKILWLFVKGFLKPAERKTFVTAHLHSDVNASKVRSLKFLFCLDGKGFSKAGFS